MNTLAVALLLGLVASGAALDCYVCDSTTAASCSDAYGMPSDHKTTCNSTETGCSKEKNKGKVFGIEAVTVVRSCGTLYDNNQCSQADHSKVSFLGIKSEFWGCSCEGDSCNDGHSVTVGVSVFVAVCAAKLLL